MKRAALRRVLIAAFVLLASMACSLTQNVPITITPTQSTVIGGIHTSTPTQTATPTNTLSPSATATSQVIVLTNLPPCTPRTDWAYQYSVAAGDTLFKIASKVNMTAQQIATGNCIANVNVITTGQILKLPVPVPTNTPVVASATPTHTPTATQQVVSPAGFINISESISGDAGFLLLLRGSTIMLTWQIAPQPYSKATFLLADASYPENPNASATVLGTDDTPENTFSVSWMVPAGLNKKLIVMGTLGNGSSVYSHSVNVVSAAAEGQSCQIAPAATAVPAYYGPDNNSGLWSEIQQGVFVEVLGRSLNGWYAIDSKIGDPLNVARLRWMPPGTDSTYTKQGAC